MFFTYLRRELTNRRKQTVIIAIGMALAIGLVIIVSAVSAGVKDAQSAVLGAIYGVGTDITITQQTEPGERGGPGAFEFGSADGSTDDGSTTLARSQLSATPGTATFDETALDTALSVKNVVAATATLSLSNSTFTGELPDFAGSAPGGPGFGQQSGPPSTGGADGEGGSAFSIDTFRVEGVTVEGGSVGPATAVTLSEGRTFGSADADSRVTVLDSSYASTAGLEVGETIAIGGEDFEIIGLAASASDAATTGSDAYIPLGVAQTLSGLDGQVNNVYIQAVSSSDIDQVSADLEEALPEASVSTQADLASSVSGSLSTASDLVSGLGTWLSIIVLAAAFLIAILFTISGVGRRTREFGTLKAIGWSNGRIVRQVAGESLVQGLIGGAIGIAIGIVGVLLVNRFAPTLTASMGTTQPGGPSDGMMATDSVGGPAMTGGFGAFREAATSTDIAMTASTTPMIILIAVGLAVLGGLVAGVFGGWRASRLRPAEALRSVA